MTDTRRHLAGTAVATALALAGCLVRAPGGDADGTPSADATWTATDAAVDPVAALEFSGRVLRQADDGGPPRIRLTVTNTADEAVELIFGHVVPFTTLIARLDERRAVSIVPDDREELSGDEGSIPTIPTERIDGCWRLDEWVLWNDSVTHRTLEPGGAVSEDYMVFDGPENEACFPAGDYRFEDRIEQRGTSEEIHLRFTLSVAPDGTVGVGAFHVG